MQNQNINVNKLVRTLNNLSPEELEFVKSTVTRATKQKVSIKEAAAFSLIQPGSRVSFVDYKNSPHEGEIKKINSKFIKIFEPHTERYFAVKPTAILGEAKAPAKTAVKAAGRRGRKAAKADVGEIKSPKAPRKTRERRQPGKVKPATVN